MGRQAIVDCNRLRSHLFHLRLLHRLEKSGGACLLRWERSGQLLSPDPQCAARHALGSAASSSACNIVDGHSGAGDPDDERSLAGGRVSSCAVVCSGDEFAIAITQSAHAARSAYGAFVRNSDFQLSIWLVNSVGIARVALAGKRVGVGRKYVMKAVSLKELAIFILKSDSLMMKFLPGN